MRKNCNNINVVLDGEEGTGEGNVQNNGTSANNENPVSGSVAPQPVVPSAVGLVTGGASAAGHQPPYDLRRKSPHHDPAAAAVAPNYPSGCNPASGSLSSNSACAAGPSGYAACMLPARKRPRRTCYTSCESKMLLINVLLFSLVTKCSICLFRRQLSRRAAKCSSLPPVWITWWSSHMHIQLSVWERFVSGQSSL